MYYNKLADRMSFGLSRTLWLVQAGIFLNMLGYGAVLPFEIIYLHDGRGFSVGTAGLAVGLITGMAVVAAPLAGPLIDRYGARAIAVWAGVALAGGYAGLALAHTPAQAFAAAALAGAGNGALNPSQSALLAALAPADRRHRAAAVSRVAGNAGIGIGGALGGLVAATGLTGFVALFLANAVTYLMYVCVLAAVVHEQARSEPVRGGYRVVVRDRAFMHLACVNVVIIGVGWGVFSWLLPPYVKTETGASTPLVGLLLLANAFTVVVAQVPVARLALTAAPALGAQLLARSPRTVFLAGAVLAAMAAVAALMLERKLPARAVLTPRLSAAPAAPSRPQGLRGR